MQLQGCCIIFRGCYNIFRERVRGMVMISLCTLVPEPHIMNLGIHSAPNGLKEMFCLGKSVVCDSKYALLQTKNI